MKKIVMMVGVIAAALGAAADTWTDPETGIEWTYTVSDGEASVGGGSYSSPAVLRSTTGAITIPSTIGGYPVTSIGGFAFYLCCGLTSVEIPSSVKIIGEWAFCDCHGLTSLTIPSSVTSIDDYAFERCSGLTSVTIPSSVTSIGDYAFTGCTGLDDGVVIVDNCVLTVNGTCPTSVVLPAGTRLIAGGAFAGCSGLTILTIPSSVTTIGDSGFFDCSGLTSVEIPSSVTNIGVHAFYGCSGLKSVTIPSSVTSIGIGAFWGCSGLTSVEIPSSVTSIGGYAFYDCSGLKSVTIPSSVASICEGAFMSCTGLTSVSIPSSVKSIGDGAFGECHNLTTVYVDVGDADRVKKMIYDSVTYASYLDVSRLQFVVSDDGGFTGEKAAVFNGLVYDAEGVVCGIVQVTTGKATKKGVKVGGFVMLEDGKKQTIKSSTVAIQDGYVKVSTKVGKLGTAAITVGGDGFKGTLGNMTLASAEADENTGILSGTLKMSYFDAKTGKIKTKSIKIGGVTAGGEAVGSATIKGQATKSFSAEVE